MSVIYDFDANYSYNFFKLPSVIFLSYSAAHSYEIDLFILITKLSNSFVIISFGVPTPQHVTLCFGYTLYNYVCIMYGRCSSIHCN